MNKKTAKIFGTCLLPLALITGCSSTESGAEAIPSSSSTVDLDSVFAANLKFSDGSRISPALWKSTFGEKTFAELQEFSKGQLCTAISAGAENAELRNMINTWYSDR